MKVLAIVTLALLAVAGVHAEEQGPNLRPSPASDDHMHKTSSNLAEMIERLEFVFKHQPKPLVAMEAEKIEKKVSLPEKWESMESAQQQHGQ